MVNGAQSAIIAGGLMTQRLFVVSWGTLVLSRPEARLTMVKAAEGFGWMAWLARAQRRRSVHASLMVGVRIAVITVRMLE